MSGGADDGPAATGLSIAGRLTIPKTLAGFEAGRAGGVGGKGLQAHPLCGLRRTKPVPDGSTASIKVTRPFAAMPVVALDSAAA